MLTAPSFVRFVKQTGWPVHGDCGVATLAMLAGVMYEDALAAVVAIQPAALQLGLTWSEMRRAAKALGLKVKITAKYDIDEATGILNVYKNPADDHFVFLWEGRVIDGNGEGWKDAGDYLKHYDYKPKSLLIALEN